MEITNEEIISMQEAKKIMEAREKEKDLVYEQKICIEFMAKTSCLTDAKLKSIKDELGHIAILKQRHIAMILDVMPDTDEEVDALFNKERTNLKKEESRQIAEIVKKYK